VLNFKNQTHQMKKTLFSLFFLSICYFSQAKIIRVNNTGIATAPASPNTTPIYTNAQTAHDAAMPGDTLHIEPSSVSYGSITISKTIVMIGNGYFLGPASANFNPGLQAKELSSVFDYIYIGGNNVVLIGCTAFQIYNSSSNSIIKRNFVTQGMTVGNAGPTNQVQIVENYFVQGISVSSTTNSIFRNNIFNTGTINFGANCNNNVFDQNTTNCDYIYLRNLTAKNNILYALYGWDFSGSAFYNNLATTTDLGTSNGNQFIAAASIGNIFEDYANTSASFSADTRWIIKATATSSPNVKTGGYAGEELGAYGGTFPYKPSGIPNIPSIYKLVAPATVTSNTMPVVISTKNNN
jgi:hypothetical protein